MHGVNRELRASGVAHVATLAQHIGIGQEVGRFAFRNVTSAASRRSGLHRVSGRPLNPALGILNRIQSDRQILLATIGVARADQMSGTSARFSVKFVNDFENPPRISANLPMISETPARCGSGGPGSTARRVFTVQLNVRTDLPTKRRKVLRSQCWRPPNAHRCRDGGWRFRTHPDTRPASKAIAFKEGGNGRNGVNPKSETPS
jgi:hypothetical protein